MTEYHDEFTDVLGAYALDAVEPEEAAPIEDHLRTCPWCAAEVAEHREVASFLSHAGTDAPPGIWDRISSELSPAAPPLQLSFGRPEVADEPGPAPAPPATHPAEGDAEVVSLDGARVARSSGAVGRRTLVAVVAAAACLVAALGVVAVNQNRRIDRLQTAAQQIPRPGAGGLQVKLESATSSRTVEAVVEADGQGYLFVDELPAPARGDVFQLWGVVDGTVLSLGTFGEGRDVVRFQVDPSQIDGVKGFVITQEHAPGVVASTQKPVVAGTVV